jgi:hypothetical protein
VATVSGLRLTAESLAGRRNRIGTVLVQRQEIPAGEPWPAGVTSDGRAGPSEASGTAGGKASDGNGIRATPSD